MRNKAAITINTTDITTPKIGLPAKTNTKPLVAGIRKAIKPRIEMPIVESKSVRVTALNLSVALILPEVKSKSIANTITRVITAAHTIKFE